MDSSLFTLPSLSLPFPYITFVLPITSTLQPLLFITKLFHFIEYTSLSFSFPCSICFPFPILSTASRRSQTNQCRVESHFVANKHVDQSHLVTTPPWSPGEVVGGAEGRRGTPSKLQVRLEGGRLGVDRQVMASSWPSRTVVGRDSTCTSQGATVGEEEEG